jgi:NADH dehydrogenase
VARSRQGTNYSKEDAIEIRRRVLQAFEAAEREPDPARRKALTTFVVIGGGPTGVELAGAIAELAHATLKGEFSSFDPAQAEIILLEGKETILPEYPAESSAKAQQALERLGVRVQHGAFVEDIQPGRLVYRQSDGAAQHLDVHTTLWAAGMRASPLTHVLLQRAGAQLDRLGRVVVDQNLAIPGCEEIYAIGDMAHYAPSGGAPLPGVAPVAMQQGRYVARQIRARLAGKSLPAFSYRDKGSLAVIGRNAAVAVFGRLRISGFPAWLAWVFIHIWYLIEFDHKVLMLIQWAWNYFTRKRGARLITGGGRYDRDGFPAFAGEPATIRREEEPSGVNR